MSDQPKIERNDGVVVERTKPRLERPKLYRVILVNDDFTPMEFVVMVLERFFHKAREQAVQIMLTVHHKGAAVCGTYPAEIAETKVRQVLDYARTHHHPLQCTMEPE